MRLIGLLLAAATAAFTALLITGNLSGGPEYQVSVLGNHIATMNTLAIFCSGLALALLFCLGVAAATYHRHEPHGYERREAVLHETAGPDTRT
ncbi:hypothetical protein [Streptomyces sp. H51]|uniref:hypothetical protein n=1 Tax=Streptomyces sp. H51 TaxID=3111770 RepID=UPI002D77FBDA|nr:hypothetical protein [Streptomyces sp. H51]